MSAASPTPFVSLFCICGDAGAKTLGRMLKSVLERPDGPMAPELVLGWNGKDDGLFLEALEPYIAVLELPRMGEVVAFWPHTTGAPPRYTLRILRHEWKNDFSAARNEVMALCRGEWVLWLDTDDIVSSILDTESKDGLTAINDLERRFKLPVSRPSKTGGHTLTAWLKQLPWNITCVRAPYDYLVDEHGKAVIYQARRRVLRRDCYLWRMPIHEIAYPKPGIVEAGIDTAGLLVRHYPTEESAAKILRNKTVLNQMQERRGNPLDPNRPQMPMQLMDYADARHAYDVANMHIAMGDLKGADDSIRVAIQRSGDALDTYRYRLTRANINIARGIYETAYAEAVAATFLKPEMQDAWMAAAEAQYLVGHWRSCIELVSMGETRKSCPQPVDFVQARELKPRSQVAVAWCELGEPQKGLPAAEEACRLYPDDELARKTLERVHHDLDKKKAIDGLLDAVQVLVSQREVEPARAILEAADESVPMRGIRWLPRFQELLAAAKAGVGRFRRDMDQGDALPEGGFQGLGEIGPSPEGARVVFYGKENAPEDEESIVRHFRAKGNQVLQVARVPAGLVARVRPTSRPPIAFYSPHAITQWDPRFPELYGIGGSESAVVYLAREVARRGYPVTVYCPTGVHLACDMGFVWRGLSSFDMREDHGILVACRAPWVLRNPDLKCPTFVWHQDNGYGSTWHWNPEIERRSAGSLHVSAWARRGLMKEVHPDLQTETCGHPHHVIGNGVLSAWCLAQMKPEDVPERNPLQVVYASDPTRGLDTLLNCWPHVLEQVPEAQLVVYGDLMTSHQLLAGVMATAREITFLQMRQKLDNTPHVSYRGRVGQHQLTQVMLGSGLYAYAGGPMPEGYGISLAQAAAAGCAVVFPEEGALPDIHDRRYMVPPVKTEEAAQTFLATLVRALQESGREELDRLAISRRMEEHTWEKVADRFEGVLEEHGFITRAASTSTSTAPARMGSAA